jgi:hypothetical protein
MACVRTAMHDHIVQTENDMIKYVRDPASALGDLAAGRATTDPGSR